MLPQHLVAEFWLKVESLLQEEHAMSAANAKKWTSEFRQLAAERIGDMVYHQDAERVADIVAGGAKHGGFREPEKSKN